MKLLTQILLIINTFWLTLNPAVPTYTEGLVGQPRSFLPSQTATKNDQTISRLIYRGLFKYDIYGTLIPDLADTWSISQDGLTYTIKLKNNQFWSNGKKINANDLIYTSFKVQNLAGVATDKVDETTVRYTLPNKYSPFLSLLTVGVMPENSEENMDPLQPLSSGPFKVVKIDRNGPVIKQVVLVDDSPKNYIKKLCFRYYANDSEVVTAAKLGEIMGFVSEKEVNLDNFEEYKYPLQGVYYSLYFNLRNEKLKDLKLRQNLRSALKIDDLTYDKGIVVQGPISRSSFTDRALDFNQYDSKATADYSDLTLKIVVPDIKVHKKLADEIANIWENKYNMDIQVVALDPDKIYDEVIKNRNFEILLYGQEVGRDPDRYINWHSTQKDFPGLNLSGFEQVRADRALEEGRNQPESTSRVIHYNEFQKVVNDQVPAIFLYHPFQKYYVSKYITGIGEKYTFSGVDRFLDFANWKIVTTN